MDGGSEEYEILPSASHLAGMEVETDGLLVVRNCDEMETKNGADIRRPAPVEF